MEPQQPTGPEPQQPAPASPPPSTPPPASRPPAAQPPAAQPPAATAPPAMAQGVPPAASSWQGPPIEDGPAPGVRFGGFGARLIAYIVDGLIQGIVFTLVSIILLAIGVGAATSDAGASPGPPLPPGSWSAS